MDAGNGDQRQAGNDLGNPDNILNNPPNIPGAGAAYGAPQIPLHDALRLIRKYNGRTNVTEWIGKFETDLLAFGIPFKFALSSLDRFFIEDALNWWRSVAHRFEIRDINEAEQAFVEMWVEVVADMKAFFDHTALQAVNRKQNKELTFKLGDDPQQFVTKKLALLSEIDRNMTEARKVRNLIRGLPVEMQLSLASQDVDTVSQFLQRLRRYSEIVEENKSKKHTPNLNNNSSSIPKPPSSTNANHHQSMHALQNNTTSRQPKQQQDTRTCFGCRQTGHISSACPLNADAALPNSGTNRNPRQVANQNNFRGPRQSPTPGAYYNPHIYQNRRHAPFNWNPFGFQQQFPPAFYGPVPPPFLGFRPPNYNNYQVPPNNRGRVLPRHPNEGMLRITEVDAPNNNDVEEQGNE